MKKRILSKKGNLLLSKRDILKQNIQRDQNVILSLKREIKLTTSSPKSKKLYSRKIKHAAKF